MRRIITFDKEELERLTKGEEVTGVLYDGTAVTFMSEDRWDKEYLGDE